MGEILVFGANGTVGRPLVKSLVAQGYAVRAVSRSGASAEGAQGFAFEFGKSEKLEQLFDDIAGAYVLLPSGYANVRELLHPVIGAAIERKVKVVFQSVLGVDADDSIPYRQIEVALEKSGTPYVILRPNWFSDNFHTFWKPGLAHGRIALPAGDGRTSFIDARDIAESAAAALISPQFDRRAFNLTGPEALSYEQAAVILSRTVGSCVDYEAISDEAFIDILAGAGVANDYASFLASIFFPVRQGWTSVVTGDVETLTGKTPRSVEQYAADNAALLKA